MARDDMSGKASNDNKSAATAGRSIDYATVSDVDREKMDKLIQAINDNPANRDLIREFGKKPMEEVGKAADKAIQAQQNYAEAFNVYSGPMKALREGTKEVESFIKESLGALKSVGSAAGKGGIKGLRFLSKLMKSMSSEKEKTDEEKEIEKIEDGLRQQITTVTKLFNDMEDSVPALKRVDADVKVMGKVLSKTNMDLAFHIGAAKEMVRRYDDEILPGAHLMMEDTTINPQLAEQNLDAVTINRNALSRRIGELQEAQLTGKTSAQRLRNTIENIAEQLDDMDFLLTIGRANIKQFVSEAGFSATTLKVAALQQGIRDAAESILDSQIAVLSKVNEMLDRTAKRGGLISHEKLLDVTQKTNQMLEDSAQAKRDNRLQLEAQSKELDTVINDQDEFLKRQRRLQLEEHSAGREKAAAVTPEFNDKAAVSGPSPVPAQVKAPANQDEPVVESDELKANMDAARERARKAGPKQG